MGMSQVVFTGGHPILNVKNVAVSLDYYCNALGFQDVFHWSRGDTPPLDICSSASCMNQRQDGSIDTIGAVRREETTMFAAEYRDHVRHRVLELARADPRVTAGALTGSTAFGGGDDWSDIDVAFGIADGITPEAVLDDWVRVFEQEWGVLDHFDLRSGSSVYRVFLLPGGLEVDVAVTPGEEFGARGPHFRALFGTTHHLEATPQPSASSLIGLGWHHVLHARSCIERHKPWQAEYWISGIRDHALALACIRLGENAYYGRGIDRLPAAVTAPLAGALVRSLDELELRRALAVATRCLISELEEEDPMLCARLSPLLQEFGASQAEASRQSSPNVLAEQ